MPVKKDVQLRVWNQNIVRLQVVQGEIGTRQLTINVIDDGGNAVDLTGYEARLYVTESSKRKTFSDATISGNVITGTIPMLASPGEAEVQIVLTKGDNEALKISGITLDVQKSDLEDSIDSSDDWSALVVLINSAQQATEAANTAAKNANTVAETVQEKLDSGELKGDPGEAGPQGEKGDKGDKGDPGPTPTFSINEEGHLIATYE